MIGATFLRAVFGDTLWQGQQEFSERPPYLAKVDGHPLADVILSLVGRLKDREQTVLIMRFGLKDGQTCTLAQLGEVLGVTTERIRQIERKALRRMRHPSRSKSLRPFLYDYSHMEESSALARRELYILLEPHMPEPLAKQMAKRMLRRHLAAALRAAKSQALQDINKLAAMSCSWNLGTCLLCDEPALPNIDWCLLHMYWNGRPWTVLVCDGCGVKFMRRHNSLLSFSRLHGRTQHAVFHSRPCFQKHGKRLNLYSRGKAKEAQIKEGDSGADMNSMTRLPNEEVLAFRKNNTAIEVEGV